MRIEHDGDGNGVLFTLVITDPHTQILVGELGYIKCEDHSIYVSRLYVVEEYRRRGIATALVKHLVDLYPKRVIRLNVKIGNYVARQLYRGLGFVFKGRERRSVHHPMQIILGRD
jgi:ribosomal protein S18 acetylase RimI-like enzyme